MVPPADIVKLAGNPVAVKLYGPPQPPLPATVTGVMGTPTTALLITAQLAEGGGLIKTEQPLVLLLPQASDTTTL